MNPLENLRDQLIEAKEIKLEKRETQVRDNSKFRVSDAGRCRLMRYWKRQGNSP